MHALLPEMKSNGWKIFELSAHTGKSYFNKKILSIIYLGGGVMEMFCYLSQLIHNPSIDK